VGCTTPSPPARLTAATSSGLLHGYIGPQMSGTAMWACSVSGVEKGSAVERASADGNDSAMWEHSLLDAPQPRQGCSSAPVANGNFRCQFSRMSVTQLFSSWWSVAGAVLLAVQFVMLLTLLWRLLPGRTRRPPELPVTQPNRDTTVSVIVATLNEVKRIQPCLDGLMAQVDPLLEVLVVDSG